MPTNQYEIPPYGSDVQRLHGWLLEAKQEGDAWLGAQKPATSWPGAQALMNEAENVVDASNVSNTVYPKSKRIARELVASLASFRHEGEYQVMWDNGLYDMAHMLTDLDASWYLTALPGEAHRATLQEAVVKGTGYWVEEWDKDFWGPGQGDIRLTSFAPSDVTFVQLPKDRDIQRAYMVILRYELPINLARRIYAPINAAFAASLVPDQETPSWLQKGLQKVQQFVAPALRVAGRTGQNNQGSYPTVDIFQAYTLDGSINDSFASIDMGAYKTNWSYTVPARGSEIRTGIPNPATGQEWTRPAKWEDCLMFPLRRLSIWSNTGVAYDGSSPWWHGDAPVARVWFNDWPWEALGGSLVSDGRTIGQGITAMMRNMEDSSEARLNPPMLFDDTLVSSSWAKEFNPRMAGARAAAPLSQGKPVELPIDARYYDVPPWIPEFMRAQEDRMDYLTGVRDIVAMAKAQQIPGADTLEKLMEMAGPIVHDMVGALEKPLTQLGEWRKAYRFQFFTTARVIRTVGPDDFAPDDWVFEPDKLKDYLSNDPTGQSMVRRYGAQGATSVLQTGNFQFSPNMLIPGGMTGLSPQAMNEKLKRLISEFRYVVTESGVNEIHRMTTKLFYLQLMKEGFPISWWTFAKIAKIPNFGPPPVGTNNEMERWVAQQHMKIDLQGDLQMELAQQMGGGQMGPGAGENPGEPPPIPDLGGTQRGRPQSYKRPPRMVQKDHGSRTSITTA